MVKNNKTKQTNEKVNDINKNIIMAMQSSNQSQQLLLNAVQEMPTQFQEELTAFKIRMQEQIGGQISEITDEIHKIKETVKTEEISGVQAEEIKKERNRRVLHLLGGIKSVKYGIFAHDYFLASAADIKQKFSPDNLTIAFNHFKKEQFNDIIKYIRNWRPNESKIKATVIAQMLQLRDKMEEYKKEIDSGKLSKSKESVLSTEICKNEKKLFKFEQYMNKQYDNYLKN
ncbi:MAG: ORF6C domain-containing protein [Bacillota bacterium]|nr:ORF6C domain-containing protein [Bacillota bacterium]